MLYIMRHGRTDWNDRHKMQGRTDTHLNENGIQMAKNACKEYGNVHFDICFCSPLARAVETAELVLKGRNVPIVLDERLVEMGFGSFEGLENSYKIPDCPINVFFQKPEEYDRAAPDAESMDELFTRTGEFLREKAYPLVEAGKDVLIIGHGAMNSCIVCQVKNRDRSQFWADGIENCKLMRLL